MFIKNKITVLLFKSNDNTTNILMVCLFLFPFPVPQK